MPKFNTKTSSHIPYFARPHCIDTNAPSGHHRFISHVSLRMYSVHELYRRMRRFMDSTLKTDDEGTKTVFFSTALRLFSFV